MHAQWPVSGAVGEDIFLFLLIWERVFGNVCIWGVRERKESAVKVVGRAIVSRLFAVRGVSLMLDASPKLPVSVDTCFVLIILFRLELGDCRIRIFAWVKASLDDSVACQ